LGALVAVAIARRQRAGSWLDPLRFVAWLPCLAASRCQIG
jgi:hypothetical protein